MLITLGTSGVMIMSMDDFNPMIQHNYLTHAHALENKFILESVVLGVTNIIDWYCSVFNTTIDEFSELTQHDNYSLIKKYPILIDEEGGSVSRLNKIINFDLFSIIFLNVAVFFICWLVLLIPSIIIAKMKPIQSIRFE